MNKNMEELIIPQPSVPQKIIHQAFRQKPLIQTFTLSVNGQAHVYPEILNTNSRRTSSFPPAQINQVFENRLTLEHAHSFHRCISEPSASREFVLSLQVFCFFTLLDRSYISITIPELFSDINFSLCFDHLKW